MQEDLLGSKHRRFSISLEQNNCSLRFALTQNSVHVNSTTKSVTPTLWGWDETVANGRRQPQGGRGQEPCRTSGLSVL